MAVDVVLADAAAALRVQRELDHLRARQSLVGPEPRHQIIARLAVDAEPGLGKLRIDQAGKGAVAAVAGQRRGGLVGLEQFAQSGIRPEVAGFDDQGIVELRRQQRFERGHVELGPGGDSHDALRREHRHGPELDFEPRRILAEIAIIEPDDLSRPVSAPGEELSERAGPLGHQAGVGPIHQHGAARRLGCFDEARNG